MNSRTLTPKLNRLQRPLYSTSSHYLKYELKVIPAYTRITSDDDIAVHSHDPTSLSVVFLVAIPNTKQALNQLLLNADLIVTTRALLPQIENLLNQYVSTRHPILTLTKDEASQVMNYLQTKQTSFQLPTTTPIASGNIPSRPLTTNEISGPANSPSSDTEGANTYRDQEAEATEEEYIDHSLPKIVREELVITGRFPGIQSIQEPHTDNPIPNPQVFNPVYPPFVFPYCIIALNAATMFYIEMEFDSDDEADIDQKLRMHALQGYQSHNRTWIMNGRGNNRRLRVCYYNLGLTGLVNELGLRVTTPGDDPIEGRMVKNSLSLVSSLISTIIEEKVIDHANAIIARLDTIAAIAVKTNLSLKTVCITFEDTGFNINNFLFESEVMKQDVGRGIQQGREFSLYSEKLNEFTFVTFVPRPFRRFHFDQEDLYLRSFSYMVATSLNDTLLTMRANSPVSTLNISNVNFSSSGTFNDLSGYFISFQ